MPFSQFLLLLPLLLPLNGEGPDLPDALGQGDQLGVELEAVPPDLLKGKLGHAAVEGLEAGLVVGDARPEEEAGQGVVDVGEEEAEGAVLAG